MKMHWSLSLPLSLLSLLPLFAAASFENTAVVRTVELGGALVHVTTTYAVRALEDGAAIYTFALTEEEAGRTSWLEAKIKGQKTKLELEKYGFNPRRYVPTPRRFLAQTDGCAIS